MLATYPWLFTGASRPLLGDHSVFVRDRLDQYFANRPGAEEFFVGATRFIEAQGCSKVGLLAGWWNEWEYPWWVLLQQSPTPLARLEHAQVDNASATLTHRAPFNNFNPCAIIVIEYSDQKRNELIVPSGIYASGWASGPVRVFIKK